MQTYIILNAILTLTHNHQASPINYRESHSEIPAVVLTDFPRSTHILHASPIDYRGSHMDMSICVDVMIGHKYTGVDPGFIVTPRDSPSIFIILM